MAFIAKHLTPAGNQSNSDGPGLWTYKTEDTHAVVDTAGYFDDASSLLRVGDLIDVVVVTTIDADPEVVSTYGKHIVLTNASGVVDVSDVTVGTVTDTD